MRPAIAMMWAMPTPTNVDAHPPAPTPFPTPKPGDCYPPVPPSPTPSPAPPDPSPTPRTVSRTISLPLPYDLRLTQRMANRGVERSEAIRQFMDEADRGLANWASLRILQAAFAAQSILKEIRPGLTPAQTEEVKAALAAALTKITHLASP